MNCERHEKQELLSGCCGVTVGEGSSGRCALCGRVVSFECPECANEAVAA